MGCKAKSEVLFMLLRFTTNPKNMGQG